MRKILLMILICAFAIYWAASFTDVQEPVDEPTPNFAVGYYDEWYDLRKNWKRLKF